MPHLYDVCMYACACVCLCLSAEFTYSEYRCISYNIMDSEIHCSI